MRDLLPVGMPVLRTPGLARALAWYGGDMGFQVLQTIPHVMAVIRRGPATLQLWQYTQPVPAPGACRIQLDEQAGNAFDLYTALSRRVRGALGEAPVLKPWGAWEFTMTDCDGSRLAFVQWAASSVFVRGQARPAGAGQNASRAP